jgi:hypothetical protein
LKGSINSEFGGLIAHMLCVNRIYFYNALVCRIILSSIIIFILILYSNYILLPIIFYYNKLFYYTLYSRILYVWLVYYYYILCSQKSKKLCSHLAASIDWKINNKLLFIFNVTISSYCMRLLLRRCWLSLRCVCSSFCFRMYVKSQYWYIQA